MNMRNMKQLRLTENIQKAINIASKLHNEQSRKGDESLPYISHPFSVAWILAGYTSDESILIAALLHDILEDVPGYYYEDLKRDLGEEVAGIVREASEDKDPNLINDDKATWQYRKSKYLEGMEHYSEKALMVCAADKIHNLQSMIAAYREQGDALWEKFNAPAEKKRWFHGEILKVLKRRLKSGIVKEYERLHASI
jgi:(p)ppGpp synthase/HD superfamily hydrolase